MIVYRITNKINGKQYVGQTTMTMINRWNKHTMRGHALYSAIKKYGKENFDYIILSECNTIQQLNDAEKYFIDYYQTLSPNGYNLTTGGEGFTVSEETKKKQSTSHKGKTAPWNSYKRSDETRKKMSDAAKGRLSKLKGTKRSSYSDKLVLCLTNGIVYKSAREASRQLKIDYKKISLVCKNKRNHTGGYKFKFVEVK